MLISFEDGMKRTSEDYAELLAEAGLRLDHVQEISPETAIVVSEAVRIRMRRLRGTAAIAVF